MVRRCNCVKIDLGQSSCYLNAFLRVRLDRYAFKDNSFKADMHIQGAEHTEDIKDDTALDQQVVDTSKTSGPY